MEPIFQDKILQNFFGTTKSCLEIRHLVELIAVPARVLRSVVCVRWAKN